MNKKAPDEPNELPNARGGPKTLVGKAISARNSWRHGYYSREAKEARRQERAKALAAFEAHRHVIEESLRNGPDLDADTFSALAIDFGQLPGLDFGTLRDPPDSKRKRKR